MSAAKMNRLEASPNGGVQVDHLTRRIAELEQANSALKNSNQLLERFAFAASHDLQEPLRMISAYAQLLRKKNAGTLDPDAAVFVGNIIDGAARMRDLLADLLTYADLSAHPRPPAQGVDLNSVLANVRQNLKASIDESGAAISSDDLPVVSGYPVDFVSLFQNLIANSIKYRSDAPPRIHISAQRTEAGVTFAVCDNGLGIEPEFHQRIFEPFQRMHHRDIPGTGLGLAICRRVINRYAGRIWVESEPGRGATVFFTVPDAGMERAAGAC